MKKGLLLPAIAFAGMTASSLFVYPAHGADESTGDSPTLANSDQIERGRLLYEEGKLASGDTITGFIKGDIELSGEQVICGSCHRRSGLGSSEAQEVVPPVTGDILYAPLRLPTSKPPLPPLLRPAYTDESLKLAIQSGIGADGDEFSGFMPRYPLSDEQLDGLLAYLKTLNTDPAPGVSDKDIHFATIIADSVTPDKRKALLDVLQTFFEQKNTETRFESERAEHGPWHKDWQFKPYRKWVLHVWDLKGSADSWQSQLEQYQSKQPVFGVLSGTAPGPWQPVHDFCEQNRIPCLYPITSLPVSDAQDFYTVYLNRGMLLEGEAVVQHLSDDKLLDRAIVQVYRPNDPRGQAAANALRGALERAGGSITDIKLQAGADDIMSQVLKLGNEAIVALWLSESDVASLWQEDLDGPARIYLSSTLYADFATVPKGARTNVYFVQPSELSAGLPRLLARSTGWFRAKRIYNSNEQEVQANAFLSVKMAGGALKAIGAYFNRDYFLESIEHMVDNATYTSIYPRISLAPNQRFISKGAYIAQMPLDANGELVAVSNWLIPGSR